MIYIILFVLFIIAIISDKDTSHEFDFTNIYNLMDTMYTENDIVYVKNDKGEPVRIGKVVCKRTIEYDDI